MKIWILTTEFQPYYGGGIGTYCTNTAKMLAEKGEEVTVFFSDTTLMQDTIIEKHGDVRLVRFRPGGLEEYQSLGYNAALSYHFYALVEKFIHLESKPDIIEFQEYLGIGYFLLHKKKELVDSLLHIPMVTYLHTPKFICDRVNLSSTYKFPDYWIGQMEKYCITAADMLMSPSKYLADFISKELDLDINKIHIIPNPYNVESQSDNFIFNNKELVFFGRMEYRKGLQDLVEQLVPLWDEGLMVPLKVIGGDVDFEPKNKTIMQYISQKYIKYIEKGLIVFEGLLSPAQVEKRLKSMGVVIVPSLFENFPYTVVESLTNKKIVIASSSGGHSELIEDSISGFIFSYGKNNFKDKLETCLNLSETEAAKIADEAKKRVSLLCSYESVYNKKIDLYNRCINEHVQTCLYPYICNISKTYVPNNTYKEKLLSIVIPYFNMGEYIDDTIESIFKSIYTEIEVIIVDDGSNDKLSLEKLKEIKQRYENIKIINKKNGGLASARNAGARASAGEYLAFLDPDDKIDSLYYSKAIKILKHYKDVYYVGSWVKHFGNSSGVWVTWDSEPPYFLVHNSMASGSLVYKTEIFIKFGINDEKYIFGMEDYESTISLIENGCMGVVITEPLFLYRSRLDSMSREFNHKSQQYIYSAISNKHKELYEKFAVDIYNIINSNGPGYLYDNPSREYSYRDLAFKKGIIRRLGETSPRLMNMVKTLLVKLKLYDIVKKIVKR